MCQRSREGYDRKPRHTEDSCCQNHQRLKQSTQANKTGFSDAHWRGARDRALQGSAFGTQIMTGQFAERVIDQLGQGDPAERNMYLRRSSPSE